MSVVIKSFSMQEVFIKLRVEYQKKASRFMSYQLNKKDFTIISNNCWGGRIYEKYGLAYNSPTIGGFIMPDEYIKFVYDLKYYLNQDLIFINPLESRYYEYLTNYPNFGKFPIGKLDDIEIVFLHYTNQDEVLKKWKRRSERVNWDRIILKFCDQNLCEYKHLLAFDKLDLPNKICFTAKPYPEFKSIIYLKSAMGKESVDINDEVFVSSKYFDFTKLINRMY